MPPGAGAELLQRDAGRRELVAIGGVDIAVPELLAQAEPAGEIEDDVGVGAGLAERRDDRPAQLDQRLRLGADVEADLQRPRARRAMATGRTTSASSAVGFMNRSAWT